MNRRLLIRCLVLLALALPLGAIINVLVAWRIASWPLKYEQQSFSDPIGADSLISARTGPLWMYQQRTAPGALRFDAMAVSDWAAAGANAMAHLPPPDWSMLATAPTDDDALMLREEAFGWPALSLTRARSLAPGGMLQPLHGIVLAQRDPNHRNAQLLLPDRIIWPGAAINTALYASLAFLAMLLLVGLVRIIAGVRRWRRRRRGRCPDCGYDLRGDNDSGCSECGWNRHRLSAISPGA